MFAALMIIKCVLITNYNLYNNFAGSFIKISLIGDETIDDYGDRLIIMYEHKEIDLDFCNLFPVFRQKLRYKKLSRILSSKI